MEFLSISLNSAKARRVVENGREYIVAPLTLIVPGVLNGSQGALYYPADEVAKNPSIWNGIPLLHNHPQDPASGRHLSGNSVGVKEKWGLGEVRKARIAANGKLRAEGWFDVESVKRVHAPIYESLNRGEPIELSTGLYTQNEKAWNGAHYNGKPYEQIARNYISDHVAILTHERGACSKDDGCGVNVVNKASEPVKDCVLNSEGVCVNCGGPGGKPGPCAHRSDPHGHIDAVIAAGQAIDHSRKVELQHPHHGVSAAVLKADKLRRRAMTEGRLGQVGKSKPGEPGHSTHMDLLAKAHLGLMTAHRDAAIYHAGRFDQSARQSHSEAIHRHENALGVIRRAQVSQQFVGNEGPDVSNCVLNTETGICVNCGGAGGKKGPCPTSGGLVAKSIAAHREGADKAHSEFEKVRSKRDEVHKQLAEYGGSPTNPGAGLHSHQFGSTAHGKINDLLASLHSHETEMKGHVAKKAEHLRQIGKLTGNTTTENSAIMYGNDPHDLTKQAAMASMEHPEAREHAIKAVDASAAGQSDKAARLHGKAAEVHDLLATAARKDKEPDEADDHDRMAMMHRKAKSTHEATVRNSDQEQSMTRDQKLAALTVNCSCDKERAVFNGMSDEHLEVVFKSAVANGQPTKASPNFADTQGSGSKQVGGEEEAKDKSKVNNQNSNQPTEVVVNASQPKPPATLAEFEASMIPEARSIWNTAKQITQEAKQNLVRRLVANVKDDKRKQEVAALLLNKEIPELQSMLELLPPPAPVANQVSQPTQQPVTAQFDFSFLGAGGGPHMMPVTNAADTPVDVTDSLDWTPTLNYAEMVEEQRKGRKTA